MKKNPVRFALRHARAGGTAAAGLGLLLLAACSAGPDYRRPQLDLPASFRDGGVDWQGARPADATPRGAWWQHFGDTSLDQLESEAAGSNLDVQVAAARWRQATELTRQAAAAWWPSLGASAAVTRAGSGSGVGTTSLTPASALSSSATISGNTDTIGLSATWEADLWGRIGRGVEADRASAEAARGDLENARLSMQGTLAQSYFSLRQVDAQRTLLDAAVAAYEKSLQLTQNRYTAGVASRADVVQAQTQLEATRAQRVDLDISRGQYEHAIAVLLGRAPETFAIVAAGQLDLAAPPVLAPAVPSVLLQRRPDVAAAERAVAAANAQIGVAQAAFYPALTLTGSAGYRGPTLSDLFKLPYRVWSLGPSLAQTVFDGGALSAAKGQAVASFDQAVGTYRKTVLTALQNVEDDLQALQVLEREAKVEEAALAAATESLVVTTNQYKAGTVSYLNVITAQTAELTARQNRLNIQARRLLSTVALYQALGGDFAGELDSPAR